MILCAHVSGCSGISVVLQSPTGLMPGRKQRQLSRHSASARNGQPPQCSTAIVDRNYKVPAARRQRQTTEACTGLLNVCFRWSFQHDLLQDDILRAEMA